MDKEAVTVRGPLPWCIEAQIGLTRAFETFSVNKCADEITSGNRQLWLLNERTWCVTEIFPDTLWIWLLEGRESITLMDAACRIALNNGLSRVAFYTLRRGFERLLAGFEPLVILTGMNGKPEMQFTIDARNYLNGTSSKQEHG